MQDDHVSGRSDAALSALREAALELGADASAVQRATDEPTLFGVIIDALLFPPGPRLSFADAAHRAHLSETASRRFWRALGNPDAASTVETIDERQAQALSFLGTAQSLIGHEAAAVLAWELGSSMGRLAETIVADFEFEMGYPRDPQGTPRIELAGFFREVVDDLLPQLSRSIDVVLRQRLAGRVPLDWPASDRGLPTTEMAVGALAFGTRPSDELVDLLDALPDEIDEILAPGGGRFVKFSHDGALYTSFDVETGCRAAMEIIRLPRVAGLRTAIGMEWGKVSTRNGGIFGPVVSTARRLAREARSAEIIVGSDFSSAVGPMSAYRLETTTRRVFRGVDGFVPVFRLVT